MFHNIFPTDEFSLSINIYLTAKTKGNSNKPSSDEAAEAEIAH